ncbi:MAG: WD40 repeat domain-containing protein [Candidatus Omnitrophica bacterium]|nr:WD40 repeat domain-containing protein [Candidatus Omnitrophota bacterium]
MEIEDTEKVWHLIEYYPDLGDAIASRKELARKAQGAERMAQNGRPAAFEGESLGSARDRLELVPEDHPELEAVEGCSEASFHDKNTCYLLGDETLELWDIEKDEAQAVATGVDIDKTLTVAEGVLAEGRKSGIVSLRRLIGDPQIVGEHDSPVTFLAKGGEILASIGEKDGLKLWDISDINGARKNNDITPDDLPDKDKAACCAITNDGKVLAYFVKEDDPKKENRLIFWDIDNGEKIGKINAEQIYRTGNTKDILNLEFSVDDRILSIGEKVIDVVGSGSTETFHGLPDGQKFSQFDSIKALKSMDDNTFHGSNYGESHPVFPGIFLYCTKEGIYLYDVYDQGYAASISHSLGEIRDIRFSPDGTRVIAVGKNGKPKIWEVKEKGERKKEKTGVGAEGVENADLLQERAELVREIPEEDRKEYIAARKAKVEKLLDEKKEALRENIRKGTGKIVRVDAVKEWETIDLDNDVRIKRATGVEGGKGLWERREMVVSKGIYAGMVVCCETREDGKMPKVVEIRNQSSEIVEKIYPVLKKGPKEEQDHNIVGFKWVEAEDKLLVEMASFGKGDVNRGTEGVICYSFKTEREGVEEGEDFKALRRERSRLRREIKWLEEDLAGLEEVEEEGQGAIEPSALSSQLSVKNRVKEQGVTVPASEQLSEQLKESVREWLNVPAEDNKWVYTADARGKWGYESDDGKFNLEIGQGEFYISVAKVESEHPLDDEEGRDIIVQWGRKWQIKAADNRTEIMTGKGDLDEEIEAFPDKKVDVIPSCSIYRVECRKEEGMLYFIITLEWWRKIVDKGIKDEIEANFDVRFVTLDAAKEAGISVPEEVRGKAVSLSNVSEKYRKILEKLAATGGELKEYDNGTISWQPQYDGRRIDISSGRKTLEFQYNPREGGFEIVMAGEGRIDGIFQENPDSSDTFILGVSGRSSTQDLVDIVYNPEIKEFKIVIKDEVAFRFRWSNTPRKYTLSDGSSYEFIGETETRERGAAAISSLLMIPAVVFFAAWFVAAIANKFNPVLVLFAVVSLGMTAAANPLFNDGNVRGVGLFGRVRKLQLPMRLRLKKLTGFPYYSPFSVFNITDETRHANNPNITDNLAIGSSLIKSVATSAISKILKLSLNISDNKSSLSLLKKLFCSTLKIVAWSYDFVKRALSSAKTFVHRGGMQSHLKLARATGTANAFLGFGGLVSFPDRFDLVGTLVLNAGLSVIGIAAIIAGGYFLAKLLWERRARSINDGDVYDYDVVREGKEPLPRSRVLEQLKCLIKSPYYFSPLSGHIKIPKIITAIMVITISILTAGGNFMKSAATNVASNIFPQSNNVWEIALRLFSENIIILICSIIAAGLVVKRQVEHKEKASWEKDDAFFRELIYDEALREVDESADAVIGVVGLRREIIMGIDAKTRNVKVVELKEADAAANLEKLEEYRKKYRAYTSAIVGEGAAGSEEKLFDIVSKLANHMAEKDAGLLGFADLEKTRLDEENREKIADAPEKIRDIITDIPGLVPVNISEMSVYNMRMASWARRTAAGRLTSEAGFYVANNREKRIISVKVASPGEAKLLAEAHRDKVRLAKRLDKDAVPVKLQIRLAVTEDERKEIDAYGGEELFKRMEIDDLIAGGVLEVVVEDKEEHLNARKIVGELRIEGYAEEHIAVIDPFREKRTRREVPRKVLFMEYKGQATAHVYNAALEIMSREGSRIELSGVKKRYRYWRPMWFVLPPPEGIDAHELKEEIERYRKILIAA